jgi:hypothetical protein
MSENRREIPAKAKVAFAALGFMAAALLGALALA